MKIYFAGSIRGGRDDAQIYFQIIEYLKSYGTVLTEHVGNPNLAQQGEILDHDQYIHDRDTQRVSESDVVVAEVSTVSLGVGYEIGRAVEQDKRILCLYRPQEGKRLSAMIAGSSGVTLQTYTTLDEAKKYIDEFLK
ncbi:MAG: nucleoside 2-deoxyribosyltransferase [bacterium]|nr:nucleoside 2-deoxyribosyltransferase [bacterium]